MKTIKKWDTFKEENIVKESKNNKNNKDSDSRGVTMSDMDNWFKEDEEETYAQVEAQIEAQESPEKASKDDKNYEEAGMHEPETNKDVKSLLTSLSKTAK